MCATRGSFQSTRETSIASNIFCLHNLGIKISSSNLNLTSNINQLNASQMLIKFNDRSTMKTKRKKKNKFKVFKLRSSDPKNFHWHTFQLFGCSLYFKSSKPRSQWLLIVAEINLLTIRNWDKWSEKKRKISNNLFHSSVSDNTINNVKF